MQQEKEEQYSFVFIGVLPMDHVKIFGEASSNSETNQLNFITSLLRSQTDNFGISNLLP